MNNIDRRTFLRGTLLAAAAASIPARLAAQAPRTTQPAAAASGAGPDIIDTNVNLFEWPFRRLKYGETQALVDKLRSHRVTEAWAGSFEALFHKDIDGVNARLAEECRARGEGMLVPFGTVNLAWPDWEEDLRRCHEVYRMPGIRLYPAYQTFDLDHPDLPNLIRAAAERDLVIQIVGDMEDPRVHHPIVLVREPNFRPLVGILKEVPSAKVELLHWNRPVSRVVMEELISETSVVLDISRIESNGGVGRLIEGNPWSGPAMPVPVERVLFGSHAPYFPLETALLKLFESPLTLDQLQAIMNGNARRLLAKS